MLRSPYPTSVPVIAICKHLLKTSQWLGQVKFTPKITVKRDVVDWKGRFETGPVTGSGKSLTELRSIQINARTNQSTNTVHLPVFRLCICRGCSHMAWAGDKATKILNIKSLSLSLSPSVTLFPLSPFRLSPSLSLSLFFSLYLHHQARRHLNFLKDLDLLHRHADEFHRCH